MCRRQNDGDNNIESFVFTENRMESNRNSVSYVFVCVCVVVLVQSPFFFPFSIFRSIFWFCAFCLFCLGNVLFVWKICLLLVFTQHLSIYICAWTESLICSLYTTQPLLCTYAYIKRTIRSRQFNGVLSSESKIYEGHHRHPCSPFSFSAICFDVGSLLAFRLIRNRITWDDSYCSNARAQKFMHAVHVL